MMQDVDRTASEVFVFGAFRLVAAQRRLERHGAPVALGSRAFDVLRVLIENAGHVVGKQELFRRVWPDHIVEDGALRFQIASLRKTLGEGHFITNVTGRGYSFVESVSCVHVGSSRDEGTPERNVPGFWARSSFRMLADYHQRQSYLRLRGRRNN